ncbi:32988_t:CDS:2, partial [Racocetra persica]
LTIFKLKIPNSTLTEEIAKMQAIVKIKKFLCTSIEILIWYKYFSPIITVGNITGSLKLWGSLKQNAFANDNYGWNIANVIKKYTANLNITDLSSYLDNHPICYDAAPSDLRTTSFNYSSPKRTPTTFRFIDPVNNSQSNLQQ